jgi:hypothetical protein
VNVRGGDRLRVALAWNSHTGGAANLSKTDVLRADLDLRVIAPNGAVVGSFTIDNAYEFVEMIMPTSGTATIEIRQSRFDGPSETYGMAWAKVPDATVPRLISRSPVDGRMWVKRWARVSGRFSEPVRNVSGSTFTLTRLANGNRVNASVTYASSTRTAILDPHQPLALGWYEAVLRGSITDRAGKRLGTRTWRFRVSGA